MLRLFFLSICILFNTTISAQNGIKYIKPEKVKELPSDIKTSPFTITAIVSNNMNYDHDTGKELKKMLEKDFKELGLNIVEGDIASKPDIRTICVMLLIDYDKSLSNTKGSDSYTVDIRNYPGAYPTNEEKTFYRIRAKSYEKLINKLKEQLEKKK